MVVSQQSLNSVAHANIVPRLVESEQVSEKCPIILLILEVCLRMVSIYFSSQGDVDSYFGSNKNMNPMQKLRS